MGFGHKKQLRESAKGNGRNRRSSRFNRPHLETLEDRTLLDAGFQSLADNLAKRLGDLGLGLNGIVKTTANLPILNQPIQIAAAQVKTAFDVLGADLLPVLKKLNSTPTSSKL